MQKKFKIVFGIHSAVGDFFRQISILWVTSSLLPCLNSISRVRTPTLRGSVYCSSIGAEFMHIPDHERREWIQERMESRRPQPDQARILDLLIRGEVFEQVLQTRYLGTKRYSLEGEAALLPLLDAILCAAAEQGAEKAMMAMSHRGRLNVMVQIVGRAARGSFCAL